VHQPGRHFERLAGETHPRHRIERIAVVPATLVEIATRLIGKHHRIDVERIDQPTMDP